MNLLLLLDVQLLLMYYSVDLRDTGAACNGQGLLGQNEDDDNVHPTFVEKMLGRSL